MDSFVRVRVINQDTETSKCEVLVPAPASASVDIEVTYPDGKTIRYSREID